MIASTTTPRAASLLSLTAIAVSLFTAAAAAGAGATEQRTLVFDAQATGARTDGPGPDKVGHLQIASGSLRDPSGRLVGRFQTSCRWIAILANHDARERCSGSGVTSDGRVQFAGTTRESLQTNVFPITRGSGSYQGAQGSVAARTLSPNETLVTVVLSLPAPGVVRVGVVPRPAANVPFRTRANALCAQAAARLASLPRLPFDNFDPTHPNPAQLRKVGQFFTGPGDPRPILRRLDTRLHELGEPPAERDSWRRFLDARKAEIAVRQEQDSAALAGDTKRFVASLPHVDRATRQTALTAAVFGVATCSV